jgi:hypothetical protein
LGWTAALYATREILLVDHILTHYYNLAILDLGVTHGIGTRIYIKENCAKSTQKTYQKTNPSTKIRG